MRASFTASSSTLGEVLGRWIEFKHELFSAQFYFDSIERSIQRGERRILLFNAAELVSKKKPPLKLVHQTFAFLKRDIEDLQKDSGQNNIEEYLEKFVQAKADLAAIEERLQTIIKTIDQKLEETKPPHPEP